ncbi:MAG: thermostable hemolysin [Gammaproteobacteria bacterium]|nr:thermostable hemolysin [Gammaproteobacteria bacterium]MBL4890368.1 thermostable hemolysin [Rhizobiaceae bacterium]
MSLVAAESLSQASTVQLSGNAESGGAGRSQFLKQWLTLSPKFELVTEESSLRAEVEQYIGCKFESNYGASLTEFLPLFLTLRCSGQLSASAGISLGSASKKFFLEQYLDASIESELEQFCGEEVRREQLAEIGNLVATTLGASRLMFIILASILNQAGYEWMVFTAAKPLLRSLQKMGFETRVIAEAKPARLDANSHAYWGSYYDNRPQVVAGRLSNAQEAVEARSLFNLVQNFYQSEIGSLAIDVRQQGRSDA